MNIIRFITKPILSKLITTIICLTLFISCSSTIKFKKTFNIDQGVLIIPFTFKSSRFGENSRYIAVHKIGLLIEDLQTNQILEKIVLSDPDEKFISIPYLVKSEYVIKGIYLITDTTTGYRSNRIKSKIQKVNVNFEISSKQFTYLNQQLIYFARPETKNEKKERLKREGVNSTGEFVRLTSIYFEPIVNEKLETIKEVVEGRM